MAIAHTHSKFNWRTGNVATLSESSGVPKQGGCKAPIPREELKFSFWK
jgi:hypothetical protein